jgi:hypothetical protein
LLDLFSFTGHYFSRNQVEVTESLSDLIFDDIGCQQHILGLSVESAATLCRDGEEGEQRACQKYCG